MFSMGEYKSWTQLRRNVNQAASKLIKIHVQHLYNSFLGLEVNKLPYVPEQRVE